MFPVSKEYFKGKDPVELAKDLLGKQLVHITPEGISSGMIVETEAYLQNDPACHASKGKTARNASMFEESGKSYVYLIYGMYHCFNVVASRKGIGEAVLVRALDPVEGIALMQERRSVPKAMDLTNGPGKLCMALGIGKGQDGLELWRPPLFIAEGKKVLSSDVGISKRIGVSDAKEAELRFFIKGNPCVSRKL